MALETMDLTCPKCGGNMDVDRGQKLLRCPYCGHEVMLDTTDEEEYEEKAYARQKGILRANAEAAKEKKRIKRRPVVIALCVIAALITAAVLYSALQPKTNPFDYITVSFSGTTGEGTAEIVLQPAKDGVNPENITYYIQPRNYLSEGDSVTVTAQSSDYVLSPTEKTYRVTGLDTYLTELNGISEKAVEMIHNKSDITVSSAINGVGTSVKAASSAPCMMYMTTDGKNGNTLYDIYKVKYPEKKGGYAERYVVIYYKNIIVRDTEEPTMSYERTMYTGQIIEALDKSYGGYMTGYKSLKDAKADILSHQSRAVKLQERPAKQ